MPLQSKLQGPGSNLITAADCLLSSSSCAELS